MSPSASLLPLPFKATVAPNITFWLAPAFAIGALFEVPLETEISTMSVLLFSVPSLTTSDIEKVPATSATKRGCSICVLSKLALLPAGAEVIDQE